MDFNQSLLLEFEMGHYLIQIMRIQEFLSYETYNHAIVLMH